MNAQLKIVHQLSQGTQAWMDFRATHYGASEAAAMLGISPYMSRTELLQLKATGKAQDHSDFTKKIFQNGHDAEAAARTLLEEDMQEDFYPVTCSKDKLSASVDGLTMDGGTAFEHKLLNNGLFESVLSQRVPDHYMAQCQQILMVTDAERVIFMCSDGTREARASVEIIKDQSWFDRIKSGWDQFTTDLANYQPKEFTDKPEPSAIMQLPALSIQIKGEVTVSNLPQFKEAAETFIENINTDLKTDIDFVNAEATVKFCGETEDKLEAAKAAAIGQTASIDELMRAIDHIKESIRQKRLTLEKSVKTQKEKIRDAIILDGFRSCAELTADLDDELTPINFAHLSVNIFTQRNFEAACKNKRTLASLHNAVDTEVAAIKIKLDDLARIVRKNLTHLPEDLSLFRDLQSIITKPEDDFKLLVESRLSEQKRKDEESAQRSIAEAKAAEERGKVHMAAAQERALMAKETASVAVPISFAPSKKTSDSIEEIVLSFVENGIEKGIALKVISLINNGKIKYITINF